MSYQVIKRYEETYMLLLNKGTKFKNSIYVMIPNI